MRKKVCVRLREIACALVENPDDRKKLYRSLKKRYWAQPWLKRRWWLRGMERFASRVREREL